MFRRTTLSALAGLSLALSLALPASVRAQVVDPAPLSVLPNPAPAGKAFTLTLQGVYGSCYTAFARESVLVTGNRIDLRYTESQLVFIADQAKPSPDIMMPPGCVVFDQMGRVDTLVQPIDPIMLNSPTFDMPALKPGTYEVWATMMPECLYSNPSCKVAVTARSAGKLVVEEQPVGIKYTIDPTTAAANKDFELSLLSYSFNCGTEFFYQSVAMNGNEITLTFLDKQKMDIACPAIYKPYGPTYKMPALKAGEYKVKAYRMPACYPCKLLGETTDAGVLTIKGTDPVTRKGWYLKEHQVLAEKPFTLQLLNQDYGNCGIDFTHKSISTAGGSIQASFLVEKKPVVCIQDLHPNGPSFEMQAMKVGVYPVYVTELLQCQVTAPFCAIKMIAPLPSDTLVVSKTLAVLLSDLRARAPKADLNGSRASVLLPEGMGGTWKAELLTVDGRRLAATAVTALGGERAEFDLGLKPERGVYLMRLSSPDGETHMIPLIRKE
jgi:hypothetical protein